MGQPYVGEIRMFAGNFAPAGWMLCQGQLLPISENSALYNLIGTTYGGDGQSTFALPDLQGRFPLHQGQGPGLSSRSIGQRFGEEQVTLTQNQIPTHNHVANCSTQGTAAAPQNKVWGTDPGGNIAPYSDVNQDSQMSGSALATVGGSQPHSNLQPFLVLNFIISLFGIYPAQG